LNSSPARSRETQIPVRRRKVSAGGKKLPVKGEEAAC
jgi:hypothetical protein